MDIIFRGILPQTTKTASIASTIPADEIHQKILKVKDDAIRTLNMEAITRGLTAKKSNIIFKLLFDTRIQYIWIATTILAIGLLLIWQSRRSTSLNPARCALVMLIPVYYRLMEIQDRITELAYRMGEIALRDGFDGFIVIGDLYSIYHIAAELIVMLVIAYIVLRKCITMKGTGITIIRVLMWGALILGAAKAVHYYYLIVSGSVVKWDVYSTARAIRELISIMCALTFYTYVGIAIVQLLTKLYKKIRAMRAAFTSKPLVSEEAPQVLKVLVDEQQYSLEVKTRKPYGNLEVIYEEEEPLPTEHEVQVNEN